MIMKNYNVVLTADMGPYPPLFVIDENEFKEFGSHINNRNPAIFFYSFTTVYGDTIDVNINQIVCIYQDKTVRK